MENPKDPHVDKAPETGTQPESGTDSVVSFAQDAFASAREAVLDVAGRAMAFFKEKADQTDLDEKAADFARKAADTAKSAVSSAAEKTRDFIEKNDLDDKAKAFGQTVSDKARELFSDAGQHGDDHKDS